MARAPIAPSTPKATSGTSTWRSAPTTPPPPRRSWGSRPPARCGRPVLADWRAPLMSAICYRDPRAALKFLEAAFGFELSMLIEDAEGNLAHSEMRYGNAVVMIGNEWTDDHKSPASIGG